MKIGTLILCRYSSSRLPGKILMNLGDKTILQQIYDKLSLVVPVDSISVATSKDSTDDIIEAYCTEHNIQCYRGSLEYVAKRFLDAARFYNYDFVTRINGDAPFVNANMYAEMLVACRSNNYDFLSNVDKRTWPVGMSIEILRTVFYEQYMTEIMSEEQYYEHVTSYFYEHDNLGKRYNYFNTRYPELHAIHLAIDEQKDLDFAQLLYQRLQPIFDHASLDQYAIQISKLKKKYIEDNVEWNQTFDKETLINFYKKDQNA